ncbi:response regulator [Bacillus sp. Marseille-P3661]|uniref:response regulator n=1 Tax=Bacillus sp. Marseille-P3661 TaxID=1936234 RepID=UPI000C849AA7|nr:response regulator [Bacillus sp. Marseille-P3661]
MIRVMIAEDEVIERKSIGVLLTKYFSENIIVVGETSNGKEALDQALELKPDIILMDVSMPVMDGLQSSEHIKQKLPDCEIIIMTAYSYFEYAKKAIRIGVTDYLVKPYPNEQFQESIERLITKVNKKRNESKHLNELISKAENLSYLLKRDMIMDLVHSRNISPSQLQHYKNILSIQDVEYVCIVYRTIKGATFSDHILEQALEKYKMITKHILGFYFLSELVVVLFSDGTNSIKDETAIKNIGSQLKQDLESDYKLSTMVGTSSIYCNLAIINNSYREAKKYFYFKQSGGVDYIQKSNLYKKENILCENIINVEEQNSINVLNEIFTEVSGKANMNQLKNYAQQLCVLIERSVIQFYEGYFKLNQIENVIREIEQIGQIEDIQFYLEEIVTEIIVSIKEQKQDQHNRMIEHVKKYLNENYMDYGISLNQTADYIGISPFYLSRSFKKQVGISFKEYLTKIRMDKAIYYLKQKKKNIQEIALEVGFVDPNYFSKAFRRYCGVSPREYIQNIHIK